MATGTKQDPRVLGAASRTDEGAAGHGGAAAPAGEAWARRQHAQLIGPIRRVLDTTKPEVVAYLAGVDPREVREALDPGGRPALLSVLRLARLAQVELFAIGAPDLVTRGPALAHDERELLATYRTLDPDGRRLLLQAAVARS